MSNDIRQILNDLDNVKFATEAGTKMHALLSRVVIGDGGVYGAPDLVAKIISVPEIARFFVADSKTEVPIAGFINNRFVSRRIDRLLIDEEAKKIYILDYKTDTDRSAFIDVYRAQLHEYVKLVGQIYPDYHIGAFILWTHDWVLESVQNT